MRRVIGVVGLLVGLGLSGCSRPVEPEEAAPSPPLPGAEEMPAAAAEEVPAAAEPAIDEATARQQAIVVLDRLKAAWEARDPDRLSGLYAPDAEILVGAKALSPSRYVDYQKHELGLQSVTDLVIDLGSPRVAVVDGEVEVVADMTYRRTGGNLGDKTETGQLRLTLAPDEGGVPLIRSQSSPE